MIPPITSGQLKKLQTLWGKLWALHGVTLFPEKVTGTLDDLKDLPRTARLMFLSGIAKRKIDSSKDLTRGEAEQAIRAIAAALPAHLNTKKKKSMSRDRAQELGTAGRKNVQATAASSMAGPEELRHIQDLLDQLGWNRQRLDEFLRSRYSPLGAHGQIRTVANANRVRWALKRILERQKKASAA
jgi:hypothetical protein